MANADTIAAAALAAAPSSHNGSHIIIFDSAAVIYDIFISTDSSG